MLLEPDFTFVTGAVALGFRNAKGFACCRAAPVEALFVAWSAELDFPGVGVGARESDVEAASFLRGV